MSEVIAERHQALVQAREAKREFSWLQSRQSAAHKERENAEKQMEIARLKFQVEKDDVDVVEGSVFASVMRAFSSERRDELEQEQAEMAAAKLKLEQAEAEISAIDNELAELDRRTQALGHVDVNLSRAAKALQDVIGGRAGPLAEQLDELAERESQLRVLRKEIDEALAAGKTADMGLSMIAGSLARVHRVESGRGWLDQLDAEQRASWLDRLDAEQHAGFMSNAATHLMLSEVRSSMGSVRHDVIRFQEECRDVANDTGMEYVDLEPMPGVREFSLIDFSNWHMLSMIDDTSFQVEQVQDQVQLAYAGLRYRREHVEAKLVEVIEQKSALLTTIMSLEE